MINVYYNYIDNKLYLGIYFGELNGKLVYAFMCDEKFIDIKKTTFPDNFIHLGKL